MRMFNIQDWDFDFEANISEHFPARDVYLNAFEKKVPICEGEDKSLTLHWLQDVQLLKQNTPAPLQASCKRVLHKVFREEKLNKIQIRHGLKVAGYPLHIADYLSATYCARKRMKKSYEIVFNYLDIILKALPLNWFIAGSYPAYMIGDCKNFNDIDLFTIVPCWFDFDLYIDSLQSEDIEVYNRLTFDRKFGANYARFTSYFNPCLNWRVASGEIYYEEKHTRISLNFLTQPLMNYNTALSYQQNPIKMIKEVLSKIDFDICRVIGVRFPYGPVTRDDHQVEFCRMTPYYGMCKVQIKRMESLLRSLMFYFPMRRERTVSTCLQMIRRRYSIRRLTLSLVCELGGLKNFDEDDDSKFINLVAGAIIIHRMRRFNKYVEKSNYRCSVSRKHVENSRVFFLQDLALLYNLR